MRAAFDARVLTPEVVAFIRECQKRAPCVLVGGAALSGAFLAHRLSKDIDLFFRSPTELRSLANLLQQAAQAAGGAIEVRQDSPEFVRAELSVGSQRLEVDLALDPSPELAPTEVIDGVRVASLPDLRAAKLTCLLSRSEPRDLVDVLFLERAGFPAEADLPLALKKDAGVDPAVMSWLLGQFPVEPMPSMLEPLTSEELLLFRDQLRDRIKRAASR
jgi:hypothetical protein